MVQPEIYCQICGVVFGIRRIRPRHEPRHAAWRTTRLESEPGLTWVGSIPGDHDACVDDSCTLVHRVPSTNSQTNSAALSDERLIDPNYVGSVASEEEALEFDSNASDGNSKTSPRPQSGDDSTRFQNDPGHDWTFSVAKSNEAVFDTEFQPLSILEDLDDGMISLQSLNDLRGEYEHISGPNCEHSEGYPGHTISLEEMEGCTTVQCLIRKQDKWESLSDDQDFEKTSTCNLTGLSKELDFIGNSQFVPIRHGNDWVSTANEYDTTLRSEEIARWVGVPFHPTCFELFRQASISELGHVDAEGLVDFRDFYCKHFPIMRPFCRRNQAVLNAFEYERWRRIAGHEYLVANPIFIPKFKAICENAANNADGFSIQQSPFAVRDGYATATRLSSTDPFARLPSELLQNVVGHLDSKGIAALRMSSRSFTHLPISTWHRLLKEEMPFIYEAWASDVKPYKWALMDAGRLQKITRQGEDYEQERHRKRETMETHEPHLLQAWLENAPEARPWVETEEYKSGMENCVERGLALQPANLLYEKTNWYQLYRDVVANRAELKGLRNRERIWADVCELAVAIRERREGTSHII